VITGVVSTTLARAMVATALTGGVIAGSLLRTLITTLAAAVVTAPLAGAMVATTLAA